MAFGKNLRGFNNPLFIAYICRSSVPQAGYTAHTFKMITAQFNQGRPEFSNFLKNAKMFEY
jgi:hypothetical protein